MAVVLCTGAQALLMKTRQMILERAGHTVIAATNIREIEQACRENDVDVVVIGQVMPNKQKQRIHDHVRQLSPITRILELHSRDRVLPHADAWLEVPADVPNELAQKVSELAGKAGKA